jgi:predicted nucleic acid-binding protein
MQNALLDAGPLIALFDNSDDYHKKVVQFFKQYYGKLYTTWPVITETMHFLNFNPQVQSDFLKWLQLDPIKIPEQNKLNLEKIRTLIIKYKNVPMDLADASLVLLAEELGIHHIITIDSDYAVYRIKKKGFVNLMK